MQALREALVNIEGVYTIRGVNPNELVHSGFGESPESMRNVCDAMNRVALAWHKRLSKEGE